jgi:hypothetical protein
LHFRGLFLHDDAGVAAALLISCTCICC